MLDWIQGRLLTDGMISPEDLDLLGVTDSVEDALAQILRPLPDSDTP